jgi:hypothetical protein
MHFAGFDLIHNFNGPIPQHALGAGIE